MKGIDFIDALSQIDPELADSYLNGASAAEQKNVPEIAATKTAATPPAVYPRRLKLISAVGLLGSVAACAALAFGIWKLSAPELSFAEQNSEMSAISLEADTAGDSADSAAEVTDAADTKTETVTASAATEKAVSKTTAVAKQAAADTTKATEQKSGPTQKTNANQNTNSIQNQKTNAAQTTAPVSGKTGKTTAQTTAKQAQTTAAKQDDMLTVPNFVGMPLDEITDRYSDTYMIRVESGGYSDYDRGIVYEQSVPAGTKIPVNEVIHIRSSYGVRPDSPIPDICGMEKDKAIRLIRKAGFDPLDQWSNFTEEPFGTVFRTKECEDGRVLLYVSNGIGGKMPDLVGIPFSEAMDLYGNSIEIVISAYVASDKQIGTILEQSVEPGTEIKRDFDYNALRHDRTRVYITIAGTGSMLEPVDHMPDMVGSVLKMGLYDSPEALQTIMTANAHVALDYVFDGDSDAPFGTVLSQFPAPGEPVWENSTVTLFISKPENDEDESVSLPDLTGKPLSEAINAISSYGCEPIIGKNVFRPDLPDFTVVETFPGDLSSIRKGSGVRLIISVTNPLLADPE